MWREWGKSTSGFEPLDPMIMNSSAPRSCAPPAMEGALASTIVTSWTASAAEEEEDAEDEEEDAEDDEEDDEEEDDEEDDEEDAAAASLFSESLSESRSISIASSTLLPLFPCAFPIPHVKNFRRSREAPSAHIP